MKILKTVINLFKDNLASIILALCGAVKAFFTYKNSSIQNKQEEKKEEKQKEFEKKVDKVVDNGTLEDLLDLRK